MGIAGSNGRPEDRLAAGEGRDERNWVKVGAWVGKGMDERGLCIEMYQMTMGFESRLALE